MARKWKLVINAVLLVTVVSVWLGKAFVMMDVGIDLLARANLLLSMLAGCIPIMCIMIAFTEKPFPIAKAPFAIATVVGILFLLFSCIYLASGEEILWQKNGRLTRCCLAIPGLGQVRAVPMHYAVDAVGEYQQGKIEIRLDFYPDRSTASQYQIPVVQQVFKREIDSQLAAVSSIGWEKLQQMKLNLEQVPEQLRGTITVKVEAQV